MDINQLGFFQFDNLVQGRIPFVLVNLGVTLDHIYKGFVAMHLENVNTPCTPADALEKVQEKKLPAHYAIVVIDADGSIAKKVAEKIEKAGFTNTYYVKGGVAGLDSERKSGN